MQPKAFRGKTPVYIFERHSDAIIPWAELRRNCDTALRLVTFDSHTDTMLPFLRWGSKKARENRASDSCDFIPARIAEVDFSDVESIASAAKELWHDEQIQAAQDTGILGDAFIVALRTPPSSPDQKSPLLHYLNDGCHFGCKKTPHDNDCSVRFADLVIEDEHLAPLFQIHDVLPTLLRKDMPFILDLDLDYFRTVRSLNPENYTLLSTLAENAGIITIATEPMYVEDCRIDESITWETSLSRLLEILDASLV